MSESWTLLTSSRLPHLTDCKCGSGLLYILRRPPTRNLCRGETSKSMKRSHKATSRGGIQSSDEWSWKLPLSSAPTDPGRLPRSRQRTSPWDKNHPLQLMRLRTDSRRFYARPRGFQRGLTERRMLACLGSLHTQSGVHSASSSYGSFPKTGQAARPLTPQFWAAARWSYKSPLESNIRFAVVAFFSPGRLSTCNTHFYRRDFILHFTS